ncbi:hypothetical protein Z043_108444, partial [Scleropages formosus]
MRRGAEFSVFQPGSPSRRAPPEQSGSHLRKPKSLTNLVLLSATEHGGCASQTGALGPREDGPRREDPEEAGGASRVRSLSLSLSRVLSSSEHSLFPGALGRFCASLGCPRGEVIAPDRVWEATDEEGSSGRSDDEGQAQVTEEGHWCVREGTAHLDQEVILTMLGDLEQALQVHPGRGHHWHFAWNKSLLASNLCLTRYAAPRCLPGEDPETRRMRTVKNIADLRQNLEETMSSLRGTQISH